ncbi:hypothetical protein DMUE_0852 [Dictyocoela muelleri]|nr:hypothetical protein DMUE_0852 [Dictyocoela muelleri]
MLFSVSKAIQSILILSIFLLKIYSAEGGYSSSSDPDQSISIEEEVYDRACKLFALKLRTLGFYKPNVTKESFNFSKLKEHLSNVVICFHPNLICTITKKDENSQFKDKNNPKEDFLSIYFEGEYPMEIKLNSLNTRRFFTKRINLETLGDYNSGLKKVSLIFANEKLSSSKQKKEPVVFTNLKILFRSQDFKSSCKRSVSDFKVLTEHYIPIFNDLLASLTPDNKSTENSSNQFKEESDKKFKKDSSSQSNYPNYASLNNKEHKSESRDEQAAGSSSKERKESFSSDISVFPPESFEYDTLSDISELSVTSPSRRYRRARNNRERDTQ